MKKIVLIGDSIRLGYEAYVRSAFGGIAEVYSPKENCRFAHYVFRYLHEWKALGEWPSDADIVHWNAGLWDTLRLYGDEPLTPPDMYGEMIRRIDKRLRLLFPKAKMIFATSTPVIEEKYGRMMESTAPEEYAKISAGFPAINDKKRSFHYISNKEM